ncbi:sortase B protein-sorting domain-containing protein [Anaerosacchariphilus polymeriproducens]|uniref:Sortase B protein-sorting domain-containing protein n=1 Tax=Anaerosacchariphilus polymeriproducens TaxID=1812858 RepID=A0A371B0A3_9FIRM|nr:sortase B protein-sorting domain-containing protein [Anaerosacchariphilus polymeriproducens]RDU25160.1 sortase B protein-sorting domain-containing protein [Anaerosacchariphilus polymeriproducens]
MKKRFIRQIKFIILCGVLLFANIMTVFAAGDSEVLYDGETKKIVTPLGDDLFLNFKSLMPGDETQQVIKISNNFSKTVVMNLRAENADSNKFASKEEEALSKEILELLELELVVKDSRGGEKVIYTGLASGPKAAEGVSGIQLGSFKKGYDGQITAKLKVPETLGNKYAGKEAKVKWIFSSSETKVEKHTEQTPDSSNETPSKDTTNTNKKPKVLSYAEGKLKTGDVAQIGLFVILAAVSGITGCMVLKKRKKTNY